MEQPPRETGPDLDALRPPPRPQRRWPLGTLTLIVVVMIVGGVMLFGGEQEAASVSVPDLTESLGLPTQNGEGAADFAVDLLDGTPFRLSDHLSEDGRPVVLNLWASWCGPCRAEMPAFDDVSQRHTDVFFLGVAVEDSPEAARAFAEEVGVGYALAIDDADRVSRRYPTPGLPATFFISSDGLIAKTVFGQIDERQLTELIYESFNG
jgi:thiol-disulfide isomerase/thioredoxin